MVPNHNRKKDYHEFFAQMLLEYALPDELGELQHQDRPDLLCTEKDIGIEVTQAMFSNDGDVQGIFEYCKGKLLSEVKPSSIRLLAEKGYRLLFWNDIVVGYMPIEAIWVSLTPLKKAYEKKIRKLALYPQHKENNLFIFSPLFRYYEYSNLQEYIVWLSKMNCDFPQSYSKVYIFDEPVLYICNASSLDIKTYEIPRETINLICQAAYEKCQN